MESHPTIYLLLEAEGAFKDLAGREDRIIHLLGSFTIVVLRGGMKSGAPSLALRFDLPDGRVVIQETSVAVLLDVTNVIAAATGAG